MAKNWNTKEAAAAIAANDQEAIMDLGRRYPNAAVMVGKALAGDKAAVLAVLQATPDYLTFRKINDGFKVEEEEDETPEPAPKKKAAPVEEPAPKKKAKAVVEDDEDGLVHLLALEILFNTN